MPQLNPPYRAFVAHATRHVERSLLPSAGDILAAISKSEFDGG